MLVTETTLLKRTKENNPRPLIELKKITVQRLKKSDIYTEKRNNKVREALKYQRLRLFVLSFDCLLNEIKEKFNDMLLIMSCPLLDT